MMSVASRVAQDRSRRRWHVPARVPANSKWTARFAGGSRCASQERTLQNGASRELMMKRFVFVVMGSCGVGMAALAACVGDSSPMPDAGDASTEDNFVKEAGADTSTDAGPDVTPDGDAAVVTITDIAAGQFHACALASNGAVYCWGDNSLSESGSPTSKNASCMGGNGAPNGCLTTPTLVSGITATKIAAGNSVTCAIDGSGDVWCWGLNADGQLGHPAGVGDTQCIYDLSADASAPYACNPTPTKVAGVSGAVEITAGANHVCARTSQNAVYCWGGNTVGQIGNTSAGAGTSTPTQPTGLPPVSEIRAGLDYDTCAVAVSGGAVWCWGFDDWGQLDVPGATVSCNGQLCKTTPTQAVWLDGGVITGANHVAVAHAYTCATFGTSGQCWGLNFRDTYSGTSGLGPIATSDTTGLEIRWETQCTRVGDRTCWGYAAAGTLGDGTFGPDGGVLATPEALASPASVAKLSAGTNFFIALTSSSEVWAWGSNYHGELAHAQGAGSPADVHCEGSVTYCNATPQKISGLP
jgi:alpha-tubulin suppressor-like RCC1 family protein